MANLVWIVSAVQRGFFSFKQLLFLFRLNPDNDFKPMAFITEITGLEHLNCIKVGEVPKLFAIWLNIKKSKHRAYNHALTPEYFHRYSKESSIVKEIGDYRKLVQCLTLTTPTFSILKWITRTPKIVSTYPCTFNYTIEMPDSFNYPKGQWNFLWLKQ